MGKALADVQDAVGTFITAIGMALLSQLDSATSQAPPVVPPA